MCMSHISRHSQKWLLFLLVCRYSIYPRLIEIEPSIGREVAGGLKGTNLLSYLVSKFSNRYKILKQNFSVRDGDRGTHVYEN